MPRRPRRCVALTITVAAACHAADPAQPAWTGYAPEPGSSSEDDAGSGQDASLDLGTPGGGTDAPGCESIDVLFVIDNSSSMAKQQGRLLASFPGFIDGIRNTVEDVDSFHIGVVTSDAYAHNSAGCKGLGDLVTKTGGPDSSDAYCGPMLADQRFATESDDLEQAFPCVAKVGTDGAGEERPISAAVAALDPDKLAPGGCNEGFLRDEAILVLVVVTDDPPFAKDPDDAHLGDADIEGWHDAIVAAKHGNEAATVVIGFIPYEEVWCMSIHIESPNLIDFVSSFGDRGILQSVCAADYGTVFSETLATIQSTCEDFVPVG